MNINWTPSAETISNAVKLRSIVASMNGQGKYPYPDQIKAAFGWSDSAYVLAKRCLRHYMGSFITYDHFHAGLKLHGNGAEMVEGVDMEGQAIATQLRGWSITFAKYLQQNPGDIAAKNLLVSMRNMQATLGVYVQQRSKQKA